MLVCPYCKSNKRKGLVEVALRTRLPGGTGSEIAAWAADFAASGGFSVDGGGGEPPLWAESETVVAGDIVGGAERAGKRFFVQNPAHDPLRLCMNCPDLTEAAGHCGACRVSLCEGCFGSHECPLTGGGVNRTIQCVECAVPVGGGRVVVQRMPRRWR